MGMADIKKTTTRIFFFLAFVAGLLYLGGNFGLHAQVAASPTGTRISDNYISVVGSGSAKAKPDLVQVSGAQESQHEDASLALKQADEGWLRLLSVLKQTGIDESSVLSQNLSFFFDPGYSPDGRPASGQGKFRATRSFQIRVPVAKAGGLLNTLVSSGVTQIWQIQYLAKDPESLYAAARKAAVDDASAKARDWAKLAGWKGSLVIESIREAGTSGPLLGRMEKTAALSNQFNVNPGAGTDTEVFLSVELIFRLQTQAQAQ